MLNYWALLSCSCLCSCCVNSNAISKSEYIFESFMLKCVWVDINNSFCICNTRIKKLLLRFAWWVNTSSEKVFFNYLSIIYISECCNFLIMLICFNRYHFPSKEDFNSSLTTFFKSNLISVWEFKYLFIRSPVLDFSIFGSSSLHLILS